MADPADINVDELRRRARRRLVGAVVLALAVAVIVPMLLESKPKPLGDDVSVEIPPVDGTKFVNRLSEGGAGPAAAPKYDTRIAAPSPTVSAPAAASAPAASAPVPAAATSSAAPVADSERTQASAATGPSGTAPATATTAAAMTASAPAAQSASRSSYAVQLAAFSDDKGANALARRLKKAGYSAYTEPLKTSKGTLWRVRVGPYGSRDAAIAARDALKREGHSGIVASPG